MHNPHSLYDAMKTQWGHTGGLTGYEIGPKCWEWISEQFVEHAYMSTLEFGCGLSTWLFALKSKMHIAVECSPHWFAKTVSAPFIQNAVVALVELIPSQNTSGPWYDNIDVGSAGLIFVDGPEGEPNGPGRMGFLNYVMDIRNAGWMKELEPIIVIDDVNRETECALLHAVANFLERPFVLHKEGNKTFGTIGGVEAAPQIPTIFSGMGKIDENVQA